MLFAIIAAVAVLAALFFALGWPADRLVRDPSSRGALGCGGLTLGAPALTWLAIGIGLWATGSDPGITGYVVLAFLISVGTTFAGMVCARAIRSWREHRRLSQRRRQ
jgi:hypothetical protein